MPAPGPQLEPYTAFYTQDQELGATFTRSFTLPAKKKFVIQSLNTSCQTPYKGSYIKFVVTADSATFKYTFEPITGTNFPYGLYRICQPVLIIAQGKVDVEVTIVTTTSPDEEIGDLLVALTGYLQD